MADGSETESVNFSKNGIIIDEYTRIMRNTSTNGLYLTDSGGNPVKLSTASGTNGGISFDNTTSNTIYRDSGVSMWDSTESYRLQGNTTTGYLQLDLNKISLVRNASSAASSMFQFGDGGTYDQFSILEDQRGSTATNGLLFLRAKKTGDYGYATLGLKAISGSNYSEMYVNGISTNEAFRFDTNTKSHAFDIAKAGYVSVGGAVDSTNQLKVIGATNISGGATTLDNAGGYALYFKNAGTQYGAVDTFGGSLSIEAASEAILSGASGVVLKGPGIFLGPTGTSAGDTQEVKFRELAANGTAAISLKAPDTISNENRWVLPADIGSAGQILSVASVASTSMTLDWADPAYTGTIGGSVSSGYIPYASSADTLANALLFTSGATESMYLGATPGTLNAANYNTTLGYQAGDDMTEGDENTLIGQMAGMNVTTGDANTMLGRGAGTFMTTQINNTYVGSQAGYSAAGQYNTFLGALAGYNTSSDLGNMNIFVGFGAAQNMQGAAERNIAIGTYAMYSDTDAASSTAHNIAIGHESMKEISTGYNNIAIGRETLLDTKSGYNNVAVGYQAGYNVSTGHTNTLVGGQAARTLTTALGNTAIGYDSLYKATIGGENVAVG